jgi:hypothetical protein
MTGAIRPKSVWTATLMFTFLNLLITSPIQEELVSGTLEQAIEAALITMSLTEIFDLATPFSLALSLMRLSTDTATVT